MSARDPSGLPNGPTGSSRRRLLPIPHSQNRIVSPLTEARNQQGDTRSQPEQVVAAVPGVLLLQSALAVRRHQHVVGACPFVDRVLTMPQQAAQRRLADLV